MHESPRLRRLRNDHSALERLRDESTVLRFRAAGKPAQQYTIEFRGRSLARVRGRVAVVERHEVEIKLGAAYPRTMPELRWVSPIYHPNISEIGMVCLGGYGTHWVPSLNLDELCGMLWDMARYHNYDVRSPYNREAALWVANQSAFTFPLDHRPLRDLRAALGRVEVEPPPLIELDPVDGPTTPGTADVPSPPGVRSGRYAEFVRQFTTDLRGTTRSSRAPGGPIPDGPEGLVILDEAADLAGNVPPPRPSEVPARLTAADEEIVFID